MSEVDTSEKICRECGRTGTQRFVKDKPRTKKPWRCSNITACVQRRQAATKAKASKTAPATKASTTKRAVAKTRGKK